MKKVNKILMATVSILLCLVLITTSVVSGVFAKFAVTKKTDTTMKLEKFGVGVTMTVDSNKLSSVGHATVTEVADGDSITANISGLKIGPGDTLHDVVQFKFTGTPNVKMKFIFDFDISFNASNFLVPAGTGKASAATYMFPIKLQQKLIQYNSNTVLLGYFSDDKMIYPWTATQKATEFTSDELEWLALNNFWASFYWYDESTYEEGYWMNLTQTETSSMDVDYILEEVFLPNENFYFDIYTNDGSRSAGEFRFGFEWPFEFSENTYDPETRNYVTNKIYDFNEIETYFANKSSVPTFDVSYTIKLEQVE